MSLLRRKPNRPQRSRTRFIKRVSETEADRLRGEFQAPPARAVTAGTENKLARLMTLSPVTVATLPTGDLGQIAMVSDANSPSVGSTVAGSGAANALVWFNGTNWTVIGV